MSAPPKASVFTGLLSGSPRELRDTLGGTFADHLTGKVPFIRKTITVWVNEHPYR
jgi:hypothetical protein